MTTITTTITLAGAFELVHPDRVPEDATRRDELRDEWRALYLTTIRTMPGTARLRREHAYRSARRARHLADEALKRLASGWLAVQRTPRTLGLGDFVDDRFYDTIAFGGRRAVRQNRSRGQRRHRRRMLAAERRGMIA